MPLDPTQPIPDFTVLQSKVAQQKRLAEYLRKAQQANSMPQGQMVSGRFVAPSWTQYLAPLLSQYQAGAAERELGAAEKDLSEKAGAARKQWQSSLPQATAARTTVVPGDEEDPVLNQEPAQPLTPSRVIQHATAGMEIPGNENAAKMYATGALADLDREDKQTERRAEKEREWANAEAKWKADLESKAELARIRSEDVRLGIEQRKEAAAQHEATMRLIAQGNQEIARARADAARQAAEDKKADIEAKKEKLPAAQFTAYTNNKTALGNIDRTLDLLEKNPNAVGLKGFLPNAILARRGTEGEKLTRAEIANIGSLKIHDRSGASVTVSESPRLMPFIPTINDPPETVRTKLRGLKREMEDANITIEQLAEENKMRVPGKTTRTEYPPEGEFPAAPVTPAAPGALPDGWRIRP